MHAPHTQALPRKTKIQSIGKVHINLAVFARSNKVRADKCCCRWALPN